MNWIEFLKGAGCGILGLLAWMTVVYATFLMAAEGVKDGRK